MRRMLYFIVDADETTNKDKNRYLKIAAQEFARMLVQEGYVKAQTQYNLDWDRQELVFTCVVDDMKPRRLP